MNKINNILEILDLQKITKNVFVGNSIDLGWGRVYGGQIIAQALSAAKRTVTPNYNLHSSHNYFIRPGDCTLPITYEVDRVRDGKGFANRRVTAFQNCKPIFNLFSSFQVNEFGYSHQAKMPETPSPKKSVSKKSLAVKYKNSIPKSLYNYGVSDDHPILFRYAEPTDPLAKKIIKPYQAIWFKVKGILPDDQHLHKFLLAYASDNNFLATSLYPHNIDNTGSATHIASIDHSIWFYADVKMDDWVLHCVESIRSGNARGLVWGKIYNRQGVMVAACTQEGLIRPKSHVSKL